jgi:hypothetical protein
MEMLAFKRNFRGSEMGGFCAFRAVKGEEVATDGPANAFCFGYVGPVGRDDAEICGFLFGWDVLKVYEVDGFGTGDGWIAAVALDGAADFVGVGGLPFDALGALEEGGVVG